MIPKTLVVIACASLGCAQSLSDGSAFDGGPSRQKDSAEVDEDTGEGAEDSSIAMTDTGGGTDDIGTSIKDTGTAITDTGTAVTDTGTMVKDTGPSGPITGGPCISGSSGATALRIRFYNSGGKPIVAYDVWGLPDKSREKAGIFGYTIGYTPTWGDSPFGEGGLLLDSSNFVDIELSTVGLSSISKTTLSLYGRTYSGGTGSFAWQTFKGTGTSGSISSSNPYRWNPGDASASFLPGDGGVLLRIKAGSSSSLAINKIELCMEAS